MKTTTIYKSPHKTIVHPKIWNVVQSLPCGFWFVKVQKDDLTENDVYAEGPDLVWYPALLTEHGDHKNFDIVGWNWSHDCITQMENVIVT
jgi:hypothetical protein